MAFGRRHNDNTQGGEGPIYYNAPFFNSLDVTEIITLKARLEKGKLMKQVDKQEQGKRSICIHYKK